jgi:uncharacterized protein YfaS (alpha-2-macroglobulin family)
MSARCPAAANVATRLFVPAFLWALLCLGLACRPQPRLGEGPPKIDAKTKVLPAFDPAALARPAQTGLDLGGALAGPPEPPALPAPEVVDYGPTGEASDYPTIQIRFNRPMVPLGDKQRVSAEEAGFEITPKIPGSAYWAEPTRLVFEPETALPRAQSYEVKFRRRLEAVDGPALDVELAWGFGTQPPSLSMRTRYEDGMDDNGRVHWKAAVQVTASQDISLRELREHLSVRARTAPTEDAVPVEVRVREHRRDASGYRSWDFEITPKTRWPAGSEVIVQVAGELRAKVGTRPLGDAYVYSFDVAEGVRSTGLWCSEGRYDDGCELGPVRVRFSAPITRAQAKRLTVRPAPKGLDVLAVDRVWDEDRRPNAYHEVMLWGDFQRGVDYEVVIGERLRDVHGQALVGTTRHAFSFIEPPPSLALVGGTGTFMKQRGAKLGIESRHVERVRVRVAELDEDELERLLADDDFAAKGWPRGLAASHAELLTLKHDGPWGWSSHELDLSKYTGGRPAALLVELAVDSLLPRAKGRRMPWAQYGLVQISELGVSALGSLPEGVIRVARLADDQPISGASVELVAGPGGESRRVGKTDAHGLLALPGAAELPEDAMLRVRSGDDAVLLDAARLWVEPNTPEDPLRPGERTEVALMSERPLYKPGERVRAMGWAAIATPYELGGLRPLPAKTKVKIELRDHRGELVAGRNVHAKAHGKFWATLEIPETAALGSYVVSAELLDTTATATLKVEDFPVPEFEVTAAAARSDLHGGESTKLRVDASYYFGGPVPITRARSTTTCEEIDFRPPGIDSGFAVAPRLEPYWGYGRSGSALRGLPLDAAAARGHLEYEITPRAAGVSHPLRCTHSVAVADASEAEIGAEATVWVHPSFYLAARAPRALDHGEDATIELATLDFDGSAVTVDEVRVVLERRWSEPEYVKEGGERRFVGWQTKTKTLPACEAKSTGATSCRFAKLEYGSYTVRVHAKQAKQAKQGKQAEYEPKLETWLWVREPARARRPRIQVDRFEIEIDRPHPKVGETVRAEIRAPWSSGHGLLAISKGGLHEIELFELEQGRAELELEVSDAWIPGVWLHALAIEPGDAGRPPELQFAKTQVELGSDSRELFVELEVPAQAETGARLPIAVRVRDAAGEPVDGHVSGWAVDEAVLSLAPLELPDFVGQFAVGFWPGLDLIDNYRELLLPYAARPDWYQPRSFDGDWASGGLGLVGTGRGGGGSASGSYGAGAVGLLGGAQLPTRSEFSSAPIFIGDAEVEGGVAKLEGELPDNLTTFRVTAVASAPLAAGSSAAVEARFGSGDARVRVTRPLVVRAALPRILRPGDQAEVGVLVDNLGGGAGEVAIEVELKQADGIVELLGPRTANAPLGAGEQLRVPFTIRATGIGTPQFEVRARLTPSPDPERDERGKIVADALRLPLPVEPERTLSERVAVYGSLDDDGAALLPFAIPADADPSFGGLSVSVGATLLGGLEDAVAYLVDYPHGCLEQTASSLLPLIPLHRLARQGYSLGVPDLDGHIAGGVARLRTMQLADGGFAYWPGGVRSAPYASAYAAWVLHRAAKAGYRVPAAMIDDVGGYLLGLVAGWAERAGPSLTEDIEMALILSVLAERGLAEEEALATLWQRRARLPVFSQAMLLLALDAQARHEARAEPRVAELLTELRSLVDEREAVAKVETNTTRLTWYWDSDARSSALVLMAMLRADPEHPLVSKLARGLLEERRGGRWSNTQENAYALVALADYAAIYEADAPNFDGRVWLGPSLLASVHAEGRGGELASPEPSFTAMSELLDAGSQAGGEDRLLLERAGQGRMYYRVGLEWVSTAADKPAKAEGIEITRVLRGPEGVIGEDQAVSSGDLLAIDVELELPAALDHVAVEIPLPAGLQAVNLELGSGGAAMKLAGQRGAWVSHQELRRDRAVIFADHLEPGKFSTTVFLRATTPGEYLMPAGHAEMMYYPEVYGRTTARRLLVR